MLELPEPGAVQSLAALKRYEDALDALVCAGWAWSTLRAARCLWAMTTQRSDVPRDVVRTSDHEQRGG